MKNRAAYVFTLVCLALLPATLAAESTDSSIPDHLKPCPPSPNCASSLEIEDSDHRVMPLRWTGDLNQIDQVKRHLRSAVLQAGDATFVVEEEHYWRIEFRSRVFKFVDDVELLFDRQSKLIQVRSASRVGHSDFGVNRKRVERIRSLFHSADSE